MVDYFAGALAEVPLQGAPAENVAARNEAVRAMLQNNPPVVNYVRRALLESPEERFHLLDVLVDLTRREVGSLRHAGLASTTRRESTQIISVLMAQPGELLLLPLVDAVWERVVIPGEVALPRVSITVTD